MKFHYTQIFLLIWIIAFWIHHFLTYGKVESKFERSVSEKYGIQSKWEMFFGFAFILFTLNILLYFFYFPSRNWFWNFPFADNYHIDIIGIIIMCIAFILYILFTTSVGRSVKKGFYSNKRPELITDGIYKYLRNPGYLAFYLAAFGCLLIIHNIIALILFLYICIVVYGHTLGEEKKLLKIYGDEYMEYIKRTGRFFPKFR